MSTKNTGWPAFPVADWDHQTFAPKNLEETRRLLSGMSLRDYFAGKAIGALISMGYSSDAVDVDATAAYEIADAMLKAREQ